LPPGQRDELGIVLQRRQIGIAVVTDDTALRTASDDINRRLTPAILYVARRRLRRQERLPCRRIQPQLASFDRSRDSIRRMLLLASLPVQFTAEAGISTWIVRRLCAWPTTGAANAARPVLGHEILRLSYLATLLALLNTLDPPGIDRGIENPLGSVAVLLPHRGQNLLSFTIERHLPGSPAAPAP
jgi:hypothetical protein